MSLTHRFLKHTRTLHLYLGVFTAPMLLFLALSGGLQSFGLHESHRGSSYAPPAWLVTMAQFHKKQTTVLPTRKKRRPAPTTEAPQSAATAKAAPAPTPAKRNLLPMKAFFALIALSLFASVLSGLYLAWRYSRKPKLFGAVLAAGIAVPLLLLLV